MNIKEHIEAGHYPKDDKGRALVPMRGGLNATIVATDHPHGGNPIVGWSDGLGATSWTASGRWEIRDDHRDLLPPPPRKVKVRRWMVAAPNFESAAYPDRDDAVARARGFRDSQIVELTGEYEEPWS